VSLRRRLRTLVACLVLQGAALLGSPMKVEELQELLHALATPKVARTRPDGTDSGRAMPL
jgi:hypothetical protein